MMLLYDDRRACGECLASILVPEEFWLHFRKSKNACCVCGSESPDLAASTPLGWICRGCAERAMEFVVQSIDFAEWSAQQVVDTLEKGNILDRLAILSRFTDAASMIERQHKKPVDMLGPVTAENLGYVRRHPWATWVRQVACDACSELGPAMEAILVKACKRTPWQYYANTIVALSIVAPHSDQFRDLATKAAADKRKAVRKFTLESVADCDADWARQLAERLRDELGVADEGAEPPP